MAEDMFAQKGWICPKCGRVLAPSTMYCLWCCNDMKESITTTGTSIPKWDTTPIKTADTPQTEKNCNNCGTPRDKCVYCIEEDRMWTPQTEEWYTYQDEQEYNDRWQTDCAWK